jgi:hypothetical protein
LSHLGALNNARNIPFCFFGLFVYCIYQLSNALQGIVVFASVMATLGLQILFESGRQLVTKVSEALILCVKFNITTL